LHDHETVTAAVVVRFFGYVLLSFYFKLWMDHHRGCKGVVLKIISLFIPLSKNKIKINISF
jgi:hypothetical protein